MKSKFTSVVRVKKQEMDKVEAKLVVARLNVRNAEEKIALLRAKLNEFNLPKSGNIGELREKFRAHKYSKSRAKCLQRELRDSKKRGLALRAQI